MEPLETSTTLSFHGVAYVVTVCVRNQALEVQVEVDDKAGDAAAACWTAQFPANYVEDLTRKTGNYKRFPVFVNMLLSAMTHRSDAVFIDLLTTADLELYRKRKMGRQGAMRANESFESATTDKSGAAQSSKRYLILTYAVEFDRVHYPLPLNLVEKPTPEVLQRTIRRLRQAVASASSDGQTKEMEEEMRALREENRCLKATLKTYCDREDLMGADENEGDSVNGKVGTRGIDLQRELEQSMKENKELIAIYQQLRDDSSAEIARLKAEIKQLKLHQTHDSATLDRERIETRRRLNDSNAAAHEALLQLQEMKTQLEEAQLKNKEILRELAIARAKSGSTREPAQARPSRQSTRPAANGGRASVGAPTRTTRRTHSFDRFESTDDEGNQGNEYRSSNAGTQRRAFRRFDPTAYQQERQRKLEERAAATRRSKSPASRANDNARLRRQSSALNGGYTSDSSVGGYSSAGSERSRGSNHSRGRTRGSYHHQREVDARLASPKSKPPPSPRPSPSPARHVQGTWGRSPSPARSLQGRTPNSSTSTQAAPSQRIQAPDPGRRTPARMNLKSPASTKATNRRALQRPPALLADTSMDSFSDIDDRLTALQQFLKEAKQSTTVRSTTPTITTIDG